MNPVDFSNGISIFYAVSQIFALASLVFDLIAVQRKKKSDLLKMDTIAAFCSFLHYAFLGAWAGIVSKIITTIRNAIAAERTMHKRKDAKLLPLIFAVAYIVVGCFTFESVFSILPILAPCLYTVVIYTSDVKKIRYAVVITNILWLIYDISVFSIMGIVAQTILIINGLIAIYRFRKKTKKK